MGNDTLAIAEERIPTTEAADTQEIIQLHLSLLGKERVVKRGQHPKHHGCVEAEFIVGEDVPAELQHGILARPHTFRALIRFSNGAATDDRQADVHGMAVKLLGVPGTKLLPGHEDETTQDFLMVDYPAFFIRDVADYKKFSQTVVRSRTSLLVRALNWLPLIPGLIQFVILYFGFFRTHKREFKLLMAIVGRSPKRDFVNPLGASYDSATAYRLGPHAIRYGVEPQSAAGESPSNNSPDRSRLAMAVQLQAGEAEFVFSVQLQTNPETMPVEDPRVDWDRSESRFIPVARIRIPSQQFESAAQMEFCENLSFTPWHSLPEYRPLGGLNRVRKEVYQAMSAKRHELNGVAMQEPQ